MRKIRSFGLVLVLLLSMFSNVISYAAGTNLIANSSVEENPAGQGPTAWQSNSWGNNTSTLSHANDGHTGARSLKIDQTARTSGDAKWMHQAVNVSANAPYTYTSWYKANVQTEIDLQYMNAAGQYTYQFVKVIPANAAWAELSATFTTPSDATKVTVMHTIAQPGSLQTDDFSLTTATVTTPGPETPPVPPTTPTPPVNNDNLVLNSSFEAANGATPTNWTKNTWGTNNAVFTYGSTGRTGTRSVNVAMNSYTNGDAKWYADLVDVTAGKNYRYSDYYKSGVSSNVVAAFVNAQGAYTYLPMRAAPAAQAWTQYSDSFTVPAGAVKVSIYHVLDKVGTLTLDDVNLAVALPTQPGTASVPNGSVETAATGGLQPMNWQSSSWGTNTTRFAYPTNGHTGKRSVKVTMSSYTDGDAKWYFDPIAMTPGTPYRFITWYRGNTAAHPIAMFTMADGTVKYSAMAAPLTVPSTTTWQKYSDTFTVPSGAVSGSVFMFINKVGWLQTDDYSLDSYSPNGFNRPLLSMTFDDGHEENATTALPLLNNYGFKTTQCFATNFIEGQSQAIKNGVLAFKNSGHEICSHTVSHPFLTTLNKTQLTYELQHSKRYLESLTGQPIRNIATPYGDYNATVVNEIKKYYASHRSVDEGYNSKDNFSIYNIRVQNVLDTTSADQITAWIQNAQADKTWLVLVYHRVAPNPGPYDTYTNVFSQHLQRISASGIAVKTYQGALNEVLPQL